MTNKPIPIYAPRGHRDHYLIAYKVRHNLSQEDLERLTNVSLIEARPTIEEVRQRILASAKAIVKAHHNE